MSTKKKVLMVVSAILALVAMAVAALVVSVQFDQKSEFEYHSTLVNSIQLWSNGFEPNGTIPTEFTAQGEELSPSLFWDDLPPGTQSLVITAADYDGPSPSFRLMTIDHWVVYNIDPTIDRIEKAAPVEVLEEQGMKVGQNVYGGIGYIGPDPPMGEHRYFFRIYALSVPSLDLVQPTRSELMESMKDHVIAYGELVGTYGG